MMLCGKKRLLFCLGICLGITPSYCGIWVTYHYQDPKTVQISEEYPGSETFQLNRSPQPEYTKELSNSFLQPKPVQHRVQFNKDDWATLVYQRVDCKDWLGTKGQAVHINQTVYKKEGTFFSEKNHQSKCFTKVSFGMDVFIPQDPQKENLKIKFQDGEKK